MNKDKLTVTRVLGIIGAIIWAATIFLRDTVVVNNEIMKFVLGVAPNLGAVWIFASFVEYSYPIITKKDYSLKVIIMSLVSIFTLALVSEIIHDLFLNSPFDIYDMIATIIASIIYLIPFSISEKKKLTKEA